MPERFVRIYRGTDIVFETHIGRAERASFSKGADEFVLTIEADPKVKPEQEDFTIPLEHTAGPAPTLDPGPDGVVQVEVVEGPEQVEVPEAPPAAVPGTELVEPPAPPKRRRLPRRKPKA